MTLDHVKLVHGLVTDAECDGGADVTQPQELGVGDGVSTGVSIAERDIDAVQMGARWDEVRSPFRPSPLPPFNFVEHLFTSSFLHKRRV